MMNYDIIYCDPPWSYRDKGNSGNRGASHKYDLMSDSQLEQMRVCDISSANSVCFMWATFPRLDAALRVMAAWGFKYKTVAFVWVKKNKVAGTNFMGMGNWTRSNAEICLLGVRGNPKRISKNVHQIIEAPMIGHSRKPRIVRDRIEELMGDLPRIELFARDAPDGWDVWGNQAPGCIDLNLTTTEGE